RIWVPIPQTDPDQQVKIVKQDLSAPMQIGIESKYRNQIGYLQPAAGPDGAVSLSIVYHVTRREIAEEKFDSFAQGDEAYLQPDKLVPVGGKPMTLLIDRKMPADQMALGRVLYDVVGKHMQYRKDKPGWGRGDANWACDSGFG